MKSRRLKTLLDKVTGSLTVGLLGAIKHTDRRRMANFAGALMRKIGPLFKEHRIGREQLRAAFPEKSEAEIEKILAGVWDNLGRIAIEFAHLDEFSVDGFGTPLPMSSPIRRNRGRASTGSWKTAVQTLALPRISPIGSFPASVQNWSARALPRCSAGRISEP